MTEHQSLLRRQVLRPIRRSVFGYPCCKHDDSHSNFLLRHRAEADLPLLVLQALEQPDLEQEVERVRPRFVIRDDFRDIFDGELLQSICRRVST